MLHNINTPRGTSRSGHGISYNYNSANVSRTEKQKKNAKTKANQNARSNWHRAVKNCWGKTEIPFPLTALKT
jgi:hypothetical protein